MKICVYCSSSSRLDPSYYAAAESLGNIFVQNNVHAIYGGSSVGLMGKLAEVYIKADARITGVIPQFMVEVEWANPNIKDMIIVDTMHERKALLMKGADAIVALPGGTGTFEELFEAITMKRLGKILMPIVILNTNDYYRPLKELLNNAISDKFMHPDNRKMWDFVDHPSEVLPAIESAAKWSEDAIDTASY